MKVQDYVVGFLKFYKHIGRLKLRCVGNKLHLFGGP